MTIIDQGEIVLPTSRSQAVLLRVKYYHGAECAAHKGHFIRYTCNGSCTLCSNYQRGQKRISGYIAKRTDTLAFRHPVSPWPITAENMHLCPDLSPGRST